MKTPHARRPVEAKAPRRQTGTSGAAVPSSQRGPVTGSSLILVANALIGVALAVICGAVSAAKMAPRLEDELVKRSAAVCRATGSDVQYSATVSDPAMARRRLEELVREPSARVDGAWLVAQGQILADWRRDHTTPTPPGLLTDDPSNTITHSFLETPGHRHAAISCPVEAIKTIGAPRASNAGRLVLLIDTEEISGTVHQAFSSALVWVCLAILLAMGLQLAIALSVISRLSDNLAQLRETQARLVRADKLAAIGTLSAGVAHEINNPLAYVVANLEALSNAFRGPDLPRDSAEIADLREALADACQGAERVRVIVGDLKALARGDEAKVAPVDPRAVIESSINIASNEIKHRGRLVREFGEISKVDANEVRLGQVILNLLVNAAHALPADGIARNQIKVATRMAPDGRVAIEIRDNGSGIPPENLPKLFDPFFTTKVVGQGTGLGLWVCHDIVAALGGEIVVESTVGVGTVMRVLLPPSRSAAEEVLAVPVLIPSARTRVLVVDDEPMVIRSIERLIGENHAVVSSDGARDALDRIARAEQFDVILCDVMMPEMTGPEFFDALSRTDPQLASRIVFVTGGAFTPSASAFMERIPNHRIAKPFTAATLQTAIDSVLRLPLEMYPPDAREGVRHLHSSSDSTERGEPLSDLSAAPTAR